MVINWDINSREHSQPELQKYFKEFKRLPRVSKYWAGGDFDPENIKGLSDSEENRIESLKQDAKAEKQPEADIIKGVQTKIEVARLVSIGVNKSIALEQVKNSYNHVLTGAHQLRVSI